MFVKNAQEGYVGTTYVWRREGQHYIELFSSGNGTLLTYALAIYVHFFLHNDQAHDKGSSPQEPEHT